MIKKNRKLLGDDEEEEEEEEDYKELIKFQKNKIYFYADVSKKSILHLLKALKHATNYALLNGKKKIYLYIHSDGGDAYAGLSGMNHIKKNKIPVVTVVDTFVASAATFLLLGGKKRYSNENGSILIHQLSTGFWGKYCDLVDEMKNSHNLMNQIKDLYKENTKLGSKINKIIKKEINIPAKKALKYGIITKLIT